MEEKLTVRIGANLSDFERKMQKMQSKMDSVGKSMSNVGKGMTAGLTLPVAGAIAMSIKSFADLEQAVGGVETLFKDSADAVIKNSESAYKRAGVSGVDYMENVTSFSATLLQGLEGDTVAAAKAADMAMVDMSDNANKFGTDIGSVQDAYQGFAKDNYTINYMSAAQVTVQTNVGERYQRCEAYCFANRKTLRAEAYDNPVPSLEIGRCNDYGFVTQYIIYQYDDGSAHQLLNINV